MDHALHALNRFGLGARIGERRRIADPRGWLRAQLEGPPALTAPGSATPEAIGDAMRGLRMLARSDEQERREARRRLLDIAGAEARAALSARVASDRPFVERLVAFWSNHLCVSTGAKRLVVPLAGSYERDVIRPHVLGRFEDMVLASAKHPAMLMYLDNVQSIGPASPGARLGRRNGGAGRGLNENYARELLELHTLGVDGGYTQQDVQALARMLTGWSVEGLSDGPRAAARRDRRPSRIDDRLGTRRRRSADVPDTPLTAAGADGSIRFAFRPLLHEPGEKTLLGARYRDEGVAEGERAIRALCRHPSTAQFVSKKLVAHFVGDEAPAAAVEHIARAFRSSDGNLKTVAQALVDLPDAWNDADRKFRTPHDWLVAVLRAFGAHDADGQVVAALRQLRQPLWSPQAPKGFGDTLREWADPDSLLNRGELARSIAGRARAHAPDPEALLDVVDVPSGSPLRRLVSDGSIPAADRVALVLAGPSFQWR